MNAVDKETYKKMSEKGRKLEMRLREWTRIMGERRSLILSKYIIYLKNEKNKVSKISLPLFEPTISCKLLIYVMLCINPVSHTLDSSDLKHGEFL